LPHKINDLAGATVEQPLILLTLRYEQPSSNHAKITHERNPEQPFLSNRATLLISLAFFA